VTGDSHLWYQGGYRQPKPAVFQLGSGNPMSVYFSDRPIPAVVPYVVPGQWVLEGVDDPDHDDGATGTCGVRFGSGPNAAAIRQDGRGGLEQYNNALNIWEIYDTSSCGGGGNRLQGFSMLSAEDPSSDQVVALAEPVD